MIQPRPLSKREWEVVKLLLQGRSNKLIAASLGISARTVEFHLKNIYAKYEVSSRIELVLKLGNATGPAENGQLGLSTVDGPHERAENRDTLHPRMDRGAPSKDTVSIIGKELQMKNLLNNRQALAGVIAALVTGFVWVALLRRFGHVTLAAILPWVAPLVVVLGMIGIAAGVSGKRNGNTPGKVAFNAWFGTGVGAFAMLPLVAVIIVPLGKLAEWLGLVNRATLPGEVASNLVIVGMLVMWLMVGAVVGIGLSYVTIKRPGQADIRRQAPEHGL